MLKIELSNHFSYKKLLQFTLPSVIMLIFTSIYGVVDGFFVSNFVGKPSFTAVNFIMPVLMILGSVGFMFGTGGGALIAKTMGEGSAPKANQQFSLIVYSSATCGIVLFALGSAFIRPLAAALGAEGQLLENSVIYGRIILLAIPAYILQYEFQCLFATAGKPTLGLITTVAAGLTNIILDALFVAVFHWGLEGAAAATALSQCVGGIIPILYFARPNNSLLKLGKANFNGKTLKRVCANGSSELMNSISMSVVSMIYNVQLLKYAGEDGVAAYGVLMYVSLVFQAVFIGYSVGIAPVISFHYGADNYDELKGLLKKSLFLTASAAITMFVCAHILTKPFSNIFVGYDKELFHLTVRAFRIFSFSFLFAGFAVFGSAFFTALNDGFVSAAISFMRTLLFQVSAVLIFPLLWQTDGIWASIVAAEFMAVIVTVLFLRMKQRKYNY